MDTPLWISYLQEKKADYIIVIDFHSSHTIRTNEKVIYLSPLKAKEFFKNFSALCFYKSMYVYPAMGGRMSSLYKKELDDI